MTEIIRSRATMRGGLLPLVAVLTFFGCGDGHHDDNVPRQALARLQHVSADSSGDDPQSVTAMWPSPTDRGNFLALAVHVIWDSGIGKIEVPPKWRLVERSDHTGFRNLTVALYVQENASAESGTVTVAVANAVPSIKMALAEYAGVRGSDSLDQHAKSDGEGTAATSGTTPPTTQNDELWIGAIANAAGLSQCDPTNGFERVEMPRDGASTLALFDRIVTASDSAGLSVTFRGFDCTDDGQEFPTEFAGVVATFKH